MGAKNVKRVYDRWCDLPHLSFRGLAWMALRSMDDDDPPLYWGGRVDLAMALGRDVPDEDDDDPDVTKERAAAFKAVRDVLRELVRRGAISVHRPPAPDRNTCYALHLASTGDAERPLNGVGGRWPSPEESDGASQRGTKNVRDGGRFSFMTGDEKRPPEEEKEEEGSISRAARDRDEREKSPADLTTRLATQHGATADEVAAVFAAATRDGIRSVAAWTASEVGHADFTNRLAELRRAKQPAPARPACGQCVNGWLGEDDEGRPICCPICKPHAVRQAG